MFCGQKTSSVFFLGEVAGFKDDIRNVIATAEKEHEKVITVLRGKNNYNSKSTWFKGKVYRVLIINRKYF